MPYKHQKVDPSILKLIVEFILLEQKMFKKLKIMLRHDQVRSWPIELD